MPRPPLVLLTGITGLAGGRAARALRAAGARVRALVRRAADAPPGVEAFAGDLDEPASLAGACRGAAAVIHAAARLEGDGAALLRTNARGTEALVREARAAGVRRVVHVSTIAVYRDGPLVRAREDAPRGGGSAYARSKEAAEDAVLAGGLPEALVVRPPLLLGPGDRRFLPALAHAVRALAIPTTRTEGALVDALHVDDLALALVRALDAPLPAPAAVWNLAGPAPVRTGALVRAAARALGVQPCLVAVPDDLALDATDERWRAAARGAGRPALPWERVPAVLTERTMDGGRARAALGWTPRIDPASGVIESLHVP